MKFPKLLKKTQCRVPTLTGWVLFVSVVLISGCVFFLNVHNFLSVNRPLGGSILIVEGWIPDYCLEEAARVFREGDYRMLISTGGPLKQGSYLREYNTLAELAAATLKELGIPEKQIISLPSPHTRKDRTWQSALTVKDFLLDKDSCVIDLFSFSVHSRRSAYLFRKALGKKFRVGVISTENRDYDPSRWWMFSEGVRSVLSESIAYVYARVTFSAP